MRPRSASRSGTGKPLWYDEEKRRDATPATPPEEYLWGGSRRIHSQSSSGGLAAWRFLPQRAQSTNALRRDGIQWGAVSHDVTSRGVGPRKGESCRPMLDSTSTAVHWRTRRTRRVRRPAGLALRARAPDASDLTSVALHSAAIDAAEDAALDPATRHEFNDAGVDIWLRALKQAGRRGSGEALQHPAPMSST
jgi:hypothetical protein